MVQRNSSNTPRVGIGCIPVHNNRVLLVRSRNGFWSTPGGNLEYGESPIDAAIRETREEAGIIVHDVELVAVTHDIIEATAAHYVTLWFRGEVEDPTITILDTDEIVEALWCDPSHLPAPRHVYFDNLIAGRTVWRASSQEGPFPWHG
jgi:8-oxo-dGTP diphosphatase